MRRAHRIAAITKTLTERPHHVFAVGEFTDLFEVGRSTLSEDLAIIRATFEALHMGKVETISGAVGGVRYLPLLTREHILAHVEDIRMDKVNDIKRRMESGTYNVTGEEVANKLVENYFDQII